jgi:hypothetical protein
VSSMASPAVRMAAQIFRARRGRPWHHRTPVASSWRPICTSRAIPW